MTTREILSALPGKRALIVGDICLDRWCTYDPSEAEPSRETGLPRIAVIHTEVTPGAGGTVANNAVALGLGKVAVAGAIGDDGFGYELLQALAARNIDTTAMVPSKLIPTFTYTKLINSQTGREDIPRVDFIYREELPRSLEDALLDQVRRAYPHYDIIFVADQAETPLGGCVTARMRELLSEIAQHHPEKIVWADSRRRSELFRDVIVKINRDEDEAASQRVPAWRETSRSKLIFITQGADGVLILQANQRTSVSANRIENPVDICGAGDSFSAGAASALAAGASPEAAARFGNLVASITIMKKGTGVATPAELTTRG